MSEEYQEYVPEMTEEEAAGFDEPAPAAGVVNATGAEMMYMLMNSNLSGSTGPRTYQKTEEAVEQACREYRYGNSAAIDLMVAVINHRGLREALLTLEERDSLNALLTKLKTKLDGLASPKSPANLMSAAVRTLTNVSF